MTGEEFKRKVEKDREALEKMGYYWLFLEKAEKQIKKERQKNEEIDAGCGNSTS